MLSARQFGFRFLLYIAIFAICVPVFALPKQFFSKLPTSSAERKRIAPYVVEVLDAGSWVLFWRQMNREPENVSKLLQHRYLGIYSRASLEVLEQAIILGDHGHWIKQSRSSPPSNSKKGSEQGPVESQEIEAAIEARLLNSDYSGLRSIHEYPFDTSTSLGELALRYVSPAKVVTLEKFEKAFENMRYSSHPRAINQLRNRVIAPLLPWGERLGLGQKQVLLETAQRRFAEGLVKVAAAYLNERERTEGAKELTEMAEETLTAIEELSFRFAKRVRLDQEFERYLMPSTKSISISMAALDRDPESFAKGQRRNLSRVVASLPDSVSGVNSLKSKPGFFLSLQYSFEDAKGGRWQVKHAVGEPLKAAGFTNNTRGGQGENRVPSWKPKLNAENYKLYENMRSIGVLPRWSNGGAHLNLELRPFLGLPSKLGARKFANLINYFESHRQMIQYLWQHRYRTRTAAQVDMPRSLVDKLNHFRGEWQELSDLLHQEKYLTPFGRPRNGLGQINILAGLTAGIPVEKGNRNEDYVDTKNPETAWLPAFGGMSSHQIEFRLFDAPASDFLAALQIKYFNAMLQRALSGSEIVKFRAVHSGEDFEHWKKTPIDFRSTANVHLKELGLNPIEFKAVIENGLKILVASP